MAEPGIDVEALARAIVSRLSGEIARAVAHPEPLMTRAQLAQYLAVQPAQIDRLAAKGMPREYIGGEPRFERAACREWLRQNQAPRKRASTYDEPLPGVRRAQRRTARQGG